MKFIKILKEDFISSFKDLQLTEDSVRNSIDEYLTKDRTIRQIGDDLSFKDYTDMIRFIAYVMSMSKEDKNMAQPQETTQQETQSQEQKAPKKKNFGKFLLKVLLPVAAGFGAGFGTAKLISNKKK